MSRRWTLGVWIALAALQCMAPPVDARSRAVRAAFQRDHPCPANGLRKGACPGYVVDHITPLCAGGPDDPSNMQWQTREEAKAKDRLERRQCMGHKDDHDH